MWLVHLHLHWSKLYIFLNKQAVYFSKHFLFKFHSTVSCGCTASISRETTQAVYHPNLVEWDCQNRLAGYRNSCYKSARIRKMIFLTVCTRTPEWRCEKLSYRVHLPTAESKPTRICGNFNHSTPRRYTYHCYLILRLNFLQQIGSVLKMNVMKIYKITFSAVPVVLLGSFATHPHRLPIWYFEAFLKQNSA